MKNDDAYTMPMPEGATPVSMDEVVAPPAVDDFDTLKRTLLDKEGNVIPTKPKSLDPCPTCGNLHPADKYPVCVCVKCLKVGQIVWCGQCMQCAWKEFADRFGEEAEDAMFPKYGEWRRREAERLAKEGMPWDT